MMLRPVGGGLTSVDWGRLARLGILCGLALVVLADSALAQTTPSAMLDQFRSVRTAWLNTAAGYANRLFGILALIEFAWTGAILVLERTDLQGWTAALIRKMMFIGAFFALLTFGADWIPRIIESFQIFGQTASGLNSLAPSDVLAIGLNVVGNLLSAAAESGWMASFGTALAMVFAALLSFLAFLGITVQLVVTLVESYLVVGAGFLFLGFGGSRWTAPYVERYIAFAVSTGVKVMVLYLILGASLALTRNWVNESQLIAASAQPAIDALDIAGSAVLLLMVCWNVPKLAASVLGGAPALTGGDAVSTVGGVAQGALVASAAVAGLVALGAKTATTRGATVSVSQAAGPGAGASGGAAGGASSFGGGSAGGAGSSGGASGSAPRRPGGGNRSGGGGAGSSAPSLADRSGSSGGENTPMRSASVSPPQRSNPRSSSDTAPPATGAINSDAMLQGVPASAGALRDQTESGAAESRATRIVSASTNAAKNLAVGTQLTRAAQGAVPPDHAPQATPPNLRMEDSE